MGLFDLWLMLAGASAILGSVTFVALLFSKTPRSPPLSGQAALVWTAALLAGGVIIAALSTEQNSYSAGMESRVAVFVAGLGQSLAVFLIGFMSAALTGLLPEAKRPNILRTTLVLSTIVFTLSAAGQLVPR